MSIHSSSYATYLQSKHWKSLRTLALAIYGPKCWKCGRYKNPDFLELHHVTYGQNLYETTLKDVRLVCGKCHDKLEATKLGISVKDLEPVRQLLAA
jgi:predicted HNH restriction endonuclease